LRRLITSSGSIHVVDGFAVDVDNSSTSNTTTITNAGNLSSISDTLANISVAIQVLANTGDVSITNSNMIQASGIFLGNGVSVTSQLSKLTIDNSGTIDATGDSVSTAISLTGNLAANSSITNSGNIISKTKLGGSSSLGIWHDSGAINNSTITNDGIISVSSLISNSANNIFGILAFNLLGSSITNTENGSISVTNSGTGSGIRVQNAFSTQDGSRSLILNAGIIEVDAINDARGIYLAEAAINGADITNALSGEISVVSSDSQAEGINVRSNDVNDLKLTNSGTITAVGERNTFGITVSGPNPVAPNLTVLNDSMITNAAGATIIVTSNDRNARGISVTGGEDLVSRKINNTTISNAGTVTVTGYESAIGIRASGELQASSVTNSGTISVTSSDGDVTGIDVGDMIESDVDDTVTHSITMRLV